MTGGRKLKTMTATLSEIIAVKCIECMGGDSGAIADCTAVDCPLINARPQYRPDGLKKKYWNESQSCLKALPSPRKRSMTDEQKAAAAERMRNLRAK